MPHLPEEAASIHKWVGTCGGAGTDHVTFAWICFLKPYIRGAQVLAMSSLYARLCLQSLSSPPNLYPWQAGLFLFIGACFSVSCEFGASYVGCRFQCRYHGWTAPLGKYFFLWSVSGGSLRNVLQLPLPSYICYWGGCNLVNVVWVWVSLGGVWFIQHFSNLWVGSLCDD